MYRRQLLTLSMIALLAGGCSDDSGPTSSAVPATATVADQTTTVGAAPETTATSAATGQPTTATTAPVAGDPVGDQLADGANFGFITELTVQGDTATGQFDLAQLFTGDEAIVAAAEDGAEAPNDVYIRNVNPRLRPIEIGAAAAFTIIPTGDACCEPVVSTLEEFAASIGPEVPVILTVSGGVITNADGVFFP